MYVGLKGRSKRNLLIRLGKNEGWSVSQRANKLREADSLLEFKRCGLKIVILSARDIEIMRSEDRCSKIHLFVWSTRALLFRK